MNNVTDNGNIISGLIVCLSHVSSDAFQFYKRILLFPVDLRLYRCDLYRDTRIMFRMTEWIEEEWRVTFHINEVCIRRTTSDEAFVFRSWK